MKKELMEFILSIMDKTYKFLSKLRCSFCCCNSNCVVVDKSVHNCPEAEEEDKDIRELRKNKSESSLDSLKNK
tara:strand:+ start:314 stop:532 length:219 start_codon:yes stop_codon:yes gene_type:complete